MDTFFLFISSDSHQSLKLTATVLSIANHQLSSTLSLSTSSGSVRSQARLSFCLSHIALYLHCHLVGHLTWYAQCRQFLLSFLGTLGCHVVHTSSWLYEFNLVFLVKKKETKFRCCFFLFFGVDLLYTPDSVCGLYYLISDWGQWVNRKI